MIFNRPLDVLIIFAFTLLFLFDYFPNIPLVDLIPKNFLIALIVGLYVFSLLFKKYRDIDDKGILKWQIYSTAHVLFLMGLFTVLGGESSSGISFENGFLWIVLLFSVFEMVSQWRKIKRSERSVHN
ncbi:hypothetical protein [Paenisporosarcina sp. TG20]|uniref:hypothetical protein n=1 Tax=Paenisporosarcina sp. TG20 TaxID=1211706 RepID=UPI0002D7CE3D|nr:hypothetical protein [Paenisporosarcina sp. TG20]